MLPSADSKLVFNARVGLILKLKLALLNEGLFCALRSLIPQSSVLICSQRAVLAT
jgi:hypothetical protein